VLIDPARVGALLDESFHHAPIDLERGEALHVYAVLDGAGDLDYFVYTTSAIEFTGEALVIESVFPTGKILLGQQIEIRGSGFGFSNGSTRVRIAGVNTNPLPGSTDVKLAVKIPDNLAVEPEGTTVTLEVGSDLGSDAVPVIVGRPEQKPQGQLHVNFVSAEPELLVAGFRAELAYTIRSTITPAVDVAFASRGNPEAVDQTELMTPGGQLLPTPLHMEPNQEITAIAVIKQIPNADAFQFGLVAVADEITGADLRNLSTLSPTLPADPTITILDPNFTVQEGSATFDGATVAMADAAIANLEFFVELTEAGTYRAGVEPRTLIGPWLRRTATPSNGQVVVQANELSGGVARKLVVLKIGRDSEAIPLASEFRLFVHRLDHGGESARWYQLEGF
jgi:hypothetical protein